VENNPRSVAKEGNIKGTADSADMRAMQSHMELAEHVIKHDHQAMDPLVGLVYEMLKGRNNISLAELGS